MMGYAVPTHFIHVTDPPFVLAPGESLIGHRFVCGGATFGRFIFTEKVALVTTGANYIAECRFESL